MPTLNQLRRRSRQKKVHTVNTVILERNPQQKGKVIKISERSPKKPNSGKRKIAKIVFPTKTIFGRKKQTLAAIPGIGHPLKKYSNVLLRGGRANDVPGVRYKLIRGKYDFSTMENFERRKRRSFYALRKER